jgi:hypothetical protein
MRMAGTSEKEARPGWEPYAVALGLWVFISFLLPDAKLSLGILGGSPGSETTGANPFYAELGAFALAVWALASRDLRGRIPGVARRLALGWCLVVGVSAVRGLAEGHHYRDVLAEARIAVLAPALLAVGALDSRGRRLARTALAAGLAAAMLVQFALICFSPTGLYSFLVVPVAITASSHDTALQWLSAIAAVLAGGLWLSGWPALALAAGAWLLLWLSLIRSLWLVAPLGAATIAFFLFSAGRRPWALRFVLTQVVACVLGLAACLAVYRTTTPDGIFLMQFRLQRMAQTLHLASAPPVAPDVGPYGSPLLREIARRGGLYRALDAPPQARSVEQERSQDPSLGMRKIEFNAFMGGFRRSPLLGQGLGLVIPIPITKGIDMDRDPESGPAWFLSKMGLLGAGFMGCGLLWMALALWRRRNRFTAQTAAAAGVLAMLAALEIFQTGIMHSTVWLPMLILGSVLMEGPGTE